MVTQIKYYIIHKYIGNLTQIHLLENQNIKNLKNEYRIKKVEYMCFEHLLYTFIENEIHSNHEKDKEKEKEKENDIYSSNYRNNINKKFTYNSYLMSNLLKGEIKLRIENKKFIYFTIEDYFKKLFTNKNSNENTNNNFILNPNEQLNIFQTGLKKNQIKNNLNLYRLLKEIIDRKKNVECEKKEIYLKKLEILKNKKNITEEKEKGNKIVNIKFDIKDLIFEEKFKKFDKEIKQLNDYKNNDKNKNLIRKKENLIGTISNLFFKI
jgi:hypothetical protein